MASKLKRTRKKRKATVATIQTKSAKQSGRNPKTGHDERLALLTKRAIQLKSEDYTHFELAEIIRKEFKLERAPGIATVSIWLKNAYEIVDDDIKNLQWQFRLDQFKALEKMREKFVTLACLDDLKVKRWKMVEGSLEAVIDENATEEQVKCANAAVKIMARQAKLLGLDLEQKAKDAGEGPGSLQELQLWIINEVQFGSSQQVNGKPIDVESEVLELRSGIPEADAI